MDRPLNRERIRPTTSRGVTGSWFIWTYEAVEVFWKPPNHPVLVIFSGKKYFSYTSLAFL
jgi:hypothetical protein